MDDIQTSDPSPAAASQSQPSINPQLASLQFYRQVIDAERRVVTGALRFFEGIPETHQFGAAATEGRMEAMKAIPDLILLLTAAEQSVVAQIAAIEVPGPTPDPAPATVAPTEPPAPAPTEPPAPAPAEQPGEQPAAELKVGGDAT